MPAGRRGGGLEIVGGQDPEPLMNAAVRVGCKMTDKQIEQCMSMMGIDPVKPGSGSGKHGFVIKCDKAAALVKSLFPTAPECEIDRMADAMIGRSMPAFSKEDCPEELVETVCAMDPDNADCFSNVLKLGLKIREENNLRPKLAVASDIPGLGCGPGVGPAASDEPPTEAEFVVHEGTGGGKWHAYTPEALKCLLPGQHGLPYVYLRLNPGMFIAVYQSSLATLTRIFQGFVLRVGSSSVCLRQVN